MKRKGPPALNSRGVFAPSNLKIAAFILYFAVIAANIAGFYPRAPFPVWLYFVFYAALFPLLYIIAGKAAGMEEKEESRYYHLLFMIYITAAGISGGIMSPLKAAVYIIPAAVMARGMHVHAAVITVFIFLSFVKRAPEFTALDYALPAGFLLLPAVYLQQLCWDWEELSVKR